MKERRIRTNKALRMVITAGRLMEQELASVKEKCVSAGLPADAARIQLLMDAWNSSLERLRSNQNVVRIYPTGRQ